MLYSYLFIVYFSKYAIVLKELCFLIVINSVQTPLHEVHRRKTLKTGADQDNTQHQAHHPLTSATQTALILFLLIMKNLYSYR